MTTFPTFTEDSRSVASQPCGKCGKPIGTRSVWFIGDRVYHQGHDPRDRYRRTARDIRMDSALEAAFTDQPDSPLDFVVGVDDLLDRYGEYVYVLNVHGSDLVEAVLAGWRAGTRRRRFGRWVVRLARRAGTETTR